MPKIPLEDPRLWDDSDPDYAPYKQVTDSRIYWRCPKVGTQAGFPHKTIRLHENIPEQCVYWTRELVRHLESNGAPFGVVYGTYAWLIRRYMTDATSPVNRSQGQATQKVSAYYCDLLDKRIGGDPIGNMNQSRFIAMYDNLLDGGKITRAHKGMTMLRQVIRYGVAIEAEGASRMDAILGVMRFDGPKPRKVAPTYDEVMAIADFLEKQGHIGSAIQVQMQSSLGCRVTEVIGIWERGEGAFMRGNKTWRPGLLWSDFSHDLSTVTIRRSKTERKGVDETVFEIVNIPELQARLRLMPIDKRVGPVALGRDGLPITMRGSSHRWAHARDALGLRTEITCRDVRAGAITDAEDAGVDRSARAKMAGHANEDTTERYSRSTTRQSVAVTQLSEYRRRG